MISLSPSVFWLLLVLLFTLAGILLYRLIQRDDNRLEWADLVATHGALNAYKIGYWIGAWLGAWVVVKQTMTNHLDPSVFAAWLTFLAGVAVFSGMAGKDRPKHGVDDPDGGK
jgi:hypothetical protein